MTQVVTFSGQYAGVNGDKLCIFCEIRDGNRPAAIVHESDEWLAFLDIRPVFHGHVLVVPRSHVRTVMDLDDRLDGVMMSATKHISRAVKSAMNSDGIFVASNNGVSQSVEHLHIHVIPRNKKDGLRGFMWPRLKYPNDTALHETAALISEAFA